MKRLLIGVIIIIALCLCLGPLAGTPQAGCGTQKVDCRIGGDKKVGDSNFSMCYNWRKIRCEPCHGYAHFAKWCNEHFSKCEGKCWGCYWVSVYVDNNEYGCYDKHGHQHTK